MKHPFLTRLFFILRLYITLMLIFGTQKLVFILANLNYADTLSPGDWIGVVWHGWALDSVTACYLLWIPAIVVWISFFVPRLNSKRILTPYYVLMALLMSVIFVADTVMYRFWGVKIDAHDLMYAAHPKDMLASVSLWFVVVSVAVLALLTWHYVRRLRHATPATLPHPIRWTWLLLFLLLGGLQFIGIRGGLGTSVANPSYAYFSPRPFLNHAALNPLFNMVHSMPKTEDFSSEYQWLGDDDLMRTTADCYYDDPSLTDTLLRTTRPNILLIVWEGGGKCMVGNDSVAPNLTALSHEGVYFDQCYANSYRTDRGLVSIFSGWPGLTNTSLMKMPDMCHKLPAFPRLLRKAGYKTSFRYGGDVDFTNMRGYLYEAGFERVEGSESFPDSRTLSSWGAPDEYLLRAGLLPCDTPFFVSWLTLSSHEPWQVPIRHCHDDHRNAFAYTDSCLGALVADLRQSPLWDNLLIVVIPDHGVAAESNQSTASPEVAAIPMLWLGGAVRRPVVVHRLMNQSDLAATLLAQLHLDTAPMTFSRNILSPSYDSSYPTALHVFRNGLNYFDTVGTITFDCVSQQATALQPAGETDSIRLHRLQALLQLIYRKTGAL